MLEHGISFLAMYT